MTWRRWQYDGTEHEAEAPAVGPMETDVANELERLGYSPLTPPGPLRTNARRCLYLAETYDHTQSAQSLPALDRQLALAMAEARQSAEPSQMPTPSGEEEEVDEFTRHRQDRRPPPPPAASDQ